MGGFPLKFIIKMGMTASFGRGYLSEKRAADPRPSTSHVPPPPRERGCYNIHLTIRNKEIVLVSVATNSALPFQEHIPGRHTHRENSLLSNATGSSFESERSRAWSTDSSEIFGASAQNSFDDSYANGAKAKRDRFCSSGSREAIEINGSRRTKGSLKSTSSKGSMEDASPTSKLTVLMKVMYKTHYLTHICQNQQF